ncbi:DUF6119 family protein [Rhizobium sp. BK602]|uniref:DUF6119 family protein n=1 Tax=Rhizobium sp. BK602 TaxID=2586986 RepID=UPI0016093C82|nr:DUF6119 family protein [Rhizobium sp. BK602]MBB3607459.1 uncharacterized protein (TIGR04141 family) [Rhizobium sp. BK602]
MSKSRSFSIYLLKLGFDQANALVEGHPLNAEVQADFLPDGAALFVLDSEPRPPWWRSYFGVQKNLSQVGMGALVFLPTGGRCFALSFGHVAHNLKDTSYEYDFGLRVTLNSLDPKKLKSTDTVEPSAAKRQRTQLPIESELTFFDFDRDSTILRSLTGKVRDEHKDLFRHATGAGNLRISTDTPVDGLASLCEKLLELYAAEQFKISFPDIQNIVPVKDPVILNALNEQLLVALHAKEADLNLTVPEIINYSDNVFVTFSGAGASLVYDDVYIRRYYDYLASRDIEIGDVDIETLSRHSLVLADEEGTPRDRYSILKSLVFDTTLAIAGGSTFHLSEGQWYRVDNNYIARLTASLDPLCVATDLPPYTQSNEGAYNLAVAQTQDGVACLDKSSIAPVGQTQVEPCDLLAVRNGNIIFYHVKVSTLSNQLSHLFNQGINAIELLRLEDESVERLAVLLEAAFGTENMGKAMMLLTDGKCHIQFVIITRKNPANRSLNLPLFSRISLMRTMKALHVRGIARSYTFVADNSVDEEGKKKKRKKKAA